MFTMAWEGDGAEDIEKWPISSVVADDDREVAGSIHGPVRIHEQPRLD
jgi:hypothetical protein